MSPDLQADYLALQKLYDLFVALAIIQEAKRNLWRNVYQVYCKEDINPLKKSDIPLVDITLTERSLGLQQMQVGQLELREAIDNHNTAVYEHKLEEARARAAASSGWWDTFCNAFEDFFSDLGKGFEGLFTGDFGKAWDGFSSLPGDAVNIGDNLVVDGLGDLFTGGAISSREFDANYSRDKAQIDDEKSQFDGRMSAMQEEAILRLIHDMYDDDNSPFAEQRKDIWFGDGSGDWGGINGDNFINTDVQSGSGSPATQIGIGAVFGGPQTLMNGLNIWSQASGVPDKWDIHRDQVEAARMALTGFDNREKAYYIVKEAIAGVYAAVAEVQLAVDLNYGHASVFNRLLADLHSFELQLFSMLVNSMITEVNSRNQAIDSMYEAIKAQAMLDSANAGSINGGFLFAYPMMALTDYMTGLMLDPFLSQTYTPSTLNMNNVYAILDDLGIKYHSVIDNLLSDDPDQASIEAMERLEQQGWNVIGKQLNDNLIVTYADGYSYLSESGLAGVRQDLEGVHNRMRGVALIADGGRSIIKFLAKLLSQGQLDSTEDTFVQAAEETFKTQELGFELKLAGMQNKVDEANRQLAWKLELENMKYAAIGTLVGIAAAVITVVVSIATLGTLAPLVIVGLFMAFTAIGKAAGDLLFNYNNPVDDHKLPGEDQFYFDPTSRKDPFSSIESQQEDIVDSLNEGDHSDVGGDKWGTDAEALIGASENLNGLRFVQLALQHLNQVETDILSLFLSQLTGINVKNSRQQLLQNSFSENNRTTLRLLNFKEDYIRDRIEVHNRKVNQDKAIDRGWTDFGFGCVELAASVAGPFMQAGSTAADVLKYTAAAVKLAHLATNLALAIEDANGGLGELNYADGIAEIINNFHASQKGRFDAVLESRICDAMHEMGNGLVEGIGDGYVAVNASAFYRLQTKISNLYNVYLAMAVVRQAQSRILARIGGIQLTGSPLSEAIYEKRDATMASLKQCHQRVQEYVNRVNELNDLTMKMYVSIGVSALSTFLIVDGLFGNKALTAVFRGIKDVINKLSSSAGIDPSAEKTVLESKTLSGLIGESWDGKLSMNDVAAVLTRFLVSSPLLTIIIEKAYQMAVDNRGEKGKEVGVVPVTGQNSSDKFTATLARLEKQKAEMQDKLGQMQIRATQFQIRRATEQMFQQFLIESIRGAVNSLGWGRAVDRESAKMMVLKGLEKDATDQKAKEAIGRLKAGETLAGLQKRSPDLYQSFMKYVNSLPEGRRVEVMKSLELQPAKSGARDAQARIPAPVAPPNPSLAGKVLAAITEPSKLARNQNPEKGRLENIEKQVAVKTNAADKTKAAQNSPAVNEVNGKPIAELTRAELLMSIQQLVGERQKIEKQWSQLVEQYNQQLEQINGRIRQAQAAGPNADPVEIDALKKEKQKINKDFQANVAKIKEGLRAINAKLSALKSEAEKRKIELPKEREIAPAPKKTAVAANPNTPNKEPVDPPPNFARTDNPRTNEPQLQRLEQLLRQVAEKNPALFRKVISETKGKNIRELTVDQLKDALIASYMQRKEMNKRETALVKDGQITQLNSLKAERRNVCLISSLLEMELERREKSGEKVDWAGIERFRGLIKAAEAEGSAPRVEVPAVKLVIGEVISKIRTLQDQIEGAKAAIGKALNAGAEKAAELGPRSAEAEKVKFQLMELGSELEGIKIEMGVISDNVRQLEKEIAGPNGNARAKIETVNALKSRLVSLQAKAQDIQKKGSELAKKYQRLTDEIGAIKKAMVEVSSAQQLISGINKPKEEKRPSHKAEEPTPGKRNDPTAQILRVQPGGGQHGDSQNRDRQQRASAGYILNDGLEAEREEMQVSIA
jgi:hypothetical protein